MFVLELLSTLPSSIRWGREFLGFVVVLGFDYSVGGGGRHEIQEQIDNNSLAVNVNKRGLLTCMLCPPLMIQPTCCPGTLWSTCAILICEHSWVIGWLGSGWDRSSPSGHVEEADTLKGLGGADLAGWSTRQKEGSMENQSH